MLILLYIFLLPAIEAKTKVFVVPHSHNDAGWLVSIDECYTRYCKLILNNIFDLLNTRQSLKFCWSEMLFLSMWLEEYPEKKPILIDLIQQNRFEIIGGGWVQNDEALPDFELVLRQMEAGFAFARQELNISHISIGWQLDPFGHSSLTPSLFERLGFDSLVFARIDYRLKTFLEVQGNMEFIWKNDAFGSNKGIFTHVLNNHYSFPEFIRYVDYYDGEAQRCYNQLPADEEDIERCTLALEKYVEYSLTKYKTKNFLLLLGDDFAYIDTEKAGLYLEMWEKIIKNSKRMDVVFATPSEYFDAVSQSKVEFDVFEGDFFPLVNAPGRSYWSGPYCRTWTGYYTTKPYLKSLISSVQKEVRVAEMLSTFYQDKEIIAYELATCTHHDAITGTCKYPVYLDYIQRLKIEKIKVFDSLSKSFKKVFEYKKSSALINPYKVVVMFNPVNWKIKKVLKLEVLSQYVRVTEPGGKVVKSQVFRKEEQFFVLFEYELASTQLKVIFIEESSVKCLDCSELSAISSKSTIRNSYLSIKLKEGLIYSITKNDYEYILSSRLVNYESTYSGAYIFTPSFPAIRIGQLVYYSVQSGSIAQVVQSDFLFDSEIINQQLILTSEDYIELSLSLNAPINTDIFLRFDNIYKQKGWFYTFNSANLIRRYYIPEDWDTKGSNYYAINGGLLIDLKDAYLSIFPSFPIGAGMPFRNTVDLNLHRHPGRDDGLGLGDYVDDGFAVTHSWLITLNDFSLENMWRSYISHKTGPLLYYLTKNFVVTDKILYSGDFNQEIIVNNHSGVVPEEKCKYLSSATYRQDEVFLTVLNLCDKSSEIEWLGEMDEVNVGGFEVIEKRKWVSGQSFEYKYRNNSGKNVIKYKRNKKTGQISAFELKAFKASKDLVKQILTDQLKNTNYPLSSQSLWIFLIFFAFIIGIAFYSYTPNQKPINKYFSKV